MIAAVACSANAPLCWRTVLHSEPSVGPQRAGVAAAYLLLALVWTWPLALYLSTRFTADPGDPLLVTYLLWWNAHTVPYTQAWWNAPFFWPMPGALALTEHVAGLSPLATPIQLLGGSPLLAYNLLLIASVWWSGLGMHALVRRLTGNGAAAFVAGVAFALVPYRTGQLGHLQLYACWWLPVALWALHAYIETGRRRWLLVFGGSWLLQALTNGYLLLFFPLLIAAWIAWFTPWKTHARRAAAIGVTWAAFSLPLAPVLLQYLRIQQQLGLERNRAEMIFFSADWSSFLSATPLLRFWHTLVPRTTEGYLFPGLTIVTLVFLAVGASARSRVFWFYVVGALVTAGLCFGPADQAFSTSALWHPYEWLIWLPGFSGLRVPARFFLLTTVCLCVAAGIAVAHLAPRLRHQPVLALLVLAGLWIDGAITAMPMGVPPGRLAYVERGGRLLYLPIDDLRLSVRAMYQSMPDRLTVVNGYAGYVPPQVSVIKWALARQDPTILTELRRGRPLYVMVDASSDTLGSKAFIESQPGVERLGVTGGGLLFKLAATPFAPIVTPGAPLTIARRQRTPNGLLLDLGSSAIVRCLDMNATGHVGDLPATVQVQVSPDGMNWTVAYDESPGGAALLATVKDPRTTPMRLVLSAAPARFIRINTPAIDPEGISLYGP